MSTFPENIFITNDVVYQAVVKVCAIPSILVIMGILSNPVLKCPT
jgi:hypothetical protein